MARPRESLIRAVTAIEELRSRAAESDDDVRTIRDAMLRTVPSAPDEDAAALQAASTLPRAWRPQRFHAEQAAAFRSPARYRAIEAGRRSGKSEGRKREIVIAALDPDWPLDDRYIVVGAPTHQQAMRLYWRPLLRMIPKRLIREERKTDCEIELVNGALIRIIGMDRPQRAEGDPVDALYLDEFADMRLGRAVIDDHLGPSLDTPDRPAGRVTVYGTPDMRSGAHFIDLCDEWRERQKEGGSYSYHHWSSRGIVSEQAWQDAMRTLDPASFAVEYEARRVSTGNLAYYAFQRQRHVVRGLEIVRSRPLILCCDWNYDPGTATLLQEQTVEDYRLRPGIVPEGVSAFTAVVDEVFIRRSNTPQVMRAVLAKIQAMGHTGQVRVYGDPAGGAAGSAKVSGSDLDLVRQVLGPVLGDRLSMRFAPSAPRVIARLNAANARLMNAAGDVRMLVDDRCRETIRDFELVQVKAGSAGEIDKPTQGDGALRTHLTDGLGYYVEREHSIRQRTSLESVD